MKQNTLNSSIISGVLNINVSPPNLGYDNITQKSKQEDLQLPKLQIILEFVITAGIINLVANEMHVLFHSDLFVI